MGISGFIALKRDFVEIDGVGQVPTPSAPHDGLLAVAVVGDSWAAGRKIDDQLVAALRARGHHAKVSSFGVPGAKTRNILQHLRDPEKSGRLLGRGTAHYVVIFAGVNDSNGHDGPDFYGHHIRGILHIVRERGAVPVVLDIPHFGVGLMAPPSVVHRVKRAVFRLLFDSPPPGNLPAYRSALQAAMPSDGSVVLVPADALPSYHDQPAFWRDPAHLNAEGFKRAAEAIAEAIVAHRASSQDTATP